VPGQIPPPEPFTWTYRVAMALCFPMVRLWGRMTVEGLEALPRGGPTLLVANHDSQTDPLAVGVAARRRRQIRALAKKPLWEKPGLGWVLDGMGQIPIERAAGDAGALVNAVAALRGGACIGVFPEGTISVGRRLRARSGIGRLALEVPEARLVCVAVHGARDFARFPKRPRVHLRFFEPASGQTDPSETAAGLSERLLAEIRALAPPVDAGRDPARTLEKYERKLAEREQAAAKRRADAEEAERV
jgi:1-acyl-sn-glycerol-3-phosphate acyltransferase